MTNPVPPSPAEMQKDAREMIMSLSTNDADGSCLKQEYARALCDYIRTLEDEALELRHSLGMQYMVPRHCACCERKAEIGRGGPSNDLKLTTDELQAMRSSWQIQPGGAIGFPGKVTPDILAFLQRFWTMFTDTYNDKHRCISEIDRLQKLVDQAIPLMEDMMRHSMGLHHVHARRFLQDAGAYDPAKDPSPSIE